MKIQPLISFLSCSHNFPTNLNKPSNDIYSMIIDLTDSVTCHYTEEDIELP